MQAKGASWNDWLQANRQLRMDANQAFWDTHRREFHLGRYRFAANLAQDKRVLDAACGTGYGSDILATQASKVIGVDISAEAVRYAQSHYGSDKAGFVHAPVERTSLEEASFDLIVSFETIEHTLSPRAALREFARLLRPDGQLIVSAPNDWGYTRDHFIDFDRPLFETLLAERFGRVELYYNNSGGRGRFSKTAGIGPLAELRDGVPECLIAICGEPRREAQESSADVAWMLEVYDNAMWRHRQFFAAWKKMRPWPFRWLTRRWGWEGRLPPSEPR